MPKKAFQGALLRFYMVAGANGVDIALEVLPRECHTGARITLGDTIRRTGSEQRAVAVRRNWWISCAERVLWLIYTPPNGVDEVHLNAFKRHTSGEVYALPWTKASKELSTAVTEGMRRRWKMS